MKTNNQTKNGEYKEPNSLELTAKLWYSPAFIFWTIYDTWNVVIKHGGRQAVIFKAEGGKGMNEKRLCAALWLVGFIILEQEKLLSDKKTTSVWNIWGALSSEK